jgi:hypothetical protein
MAQDGHPDRIDSPVGGPIEQPELQGHLADRNLQLKELDQRKPLDSAQPTGIDPAA